MKKHGKKHIAMLAAIVVGCFMAMPFASEGQEKSKRAVPPLIRQKAPPIKLSSEHLQAVSRRRRIAVNYDVGYPTHSLGFGIEVEKWVEVRFNYADQPGSQIDSLWFCIDEGNFAFYPSKVLLMTQCPQMKKWFDAGIDILKVAVQESHRRGIEAFYTYRLNGYDGEWDADGHMTRLINLPMKSKHPDWLLQDSWTPPGAKFWNFAVEEVHNYKVAILRELAENYDFDGIDIDFARHPPCLPVGHQWEYRDAMTNFIRKVRLMLQEVANKRGRPLLLSVRVPYTVSGCHYDGLDIETWVRENLIDLIGIGIRSFNNDIEGFRRITADGHVKLYPCMDDRAHPPNGYRMNLEFERGFAANCFQQGADGILTFNWHNKGNTPHKQAYCEIGDPEIIRFKDKMFVLDRRLGGGWVEGWQFYHNNKIDAPLPTGLPAGDLPTILMVHVGDDLAGEAERVERVELRILLSGAAAANVVNVKLNGVLLPAPAVQGGWRIFKTTPRQFALGRNIVFIRMLKSQNPVTIEKLEVHVSYKGK